MAHAYQLAARRPELVAAAIVLDIGAEMDLGTTPGWTPSPAASTASTR